MKKGIVVALAVTGSLALGPAAQAAPFELTTASAGVLDHEEEPAGDDHDHDGDGEPDHDPEDHDEAPKPKPKPKPKAGA
jgi:hypothetical protein